MFVYFFTPPTWGNGSRHVTLVSRSRETFLFLNCVESKTKKGFREASNDFIAYIFISIARLLWESKLLFN